MKHRDTRKTCCCNIKLYFSTSTMFRRSIMFSHIGDHTTCLRPSSRYQKRQKNHHTFYNYFIRCIDIWTCHAWKIRIRTYTDDSIFRKIIFQLHVARLPLQNVWLHSRLCKRFHFSVQHVCVRSPVSIQNVITFKTFYLIIHVDLWGKKVRNYHDI